MCTDQWVVTGRGSKAFFLGVGSRVELGAFDIHGIVQNNYNYKAAACLFFLQRNKPKVGLANARTQTVCVDVNNWKLTTWKGPPFLSQSESLAIDT